MLASSPVTPIRTWGEKIGVTGDEAKAHNIRTRRLGQWGWGETEYRLIIDPTSNNIDQLTHSSTVVSLIDIDRVVGLDKERSWVGDSHLGHGNTERYVSGQRRRALVLWAVCVCVCVCVCVIIGASSTQYHVIWMWMYSIIVIQCKCKLVIIWYISYKFFFFFYLCNDEHTIGWSGVIVQRPSQTNNSGLGIHRKCSISLSKNSTNIKWINGDQLELRVIIE